MEKLLSLVQTVNSYLSDYVLMILLVGTGIFFTVRTKLIQRHLFYRKDLKKVIGEVTLNGKRHDSGISSFQALCAAVAAQVGTGNIVGASGAILAGGPGAIFWMWIVAVLGMSTIYAEAVLAQETRIKLPDGEILGGPVYYIKRAFPNFFGTCLAVFFACAVIVSLGFIGNMVQANSIGETLHTAVPLLNEKLIGVIIALLAFAIFAGGIKRIAVVTEKMVPFMALLYIIGGFVILACRIQYIPETFACIFKYAFNPEALIGGGLGYALKTAVSQGVKRGLFSNEAGMGSTPHAHAQAIVEKPHDQGVVAMWGVLIDTFVVLTMTALVVISTIYAGDGPLANATGSNYSELLASVGLQKTNLVQIAFSGIIGKFGGNLFVAVCLFFFAFSTILGWAFFGKVNFQYLFGKKSLMVYYLMVALFIFMGCTLKNDLVWELQDMFNQMMVLPNVIGLLALSSIVVKAVEIRK